MAARVTRALAATTLVLAAFWLSGGAALAQMSHQIRTATDGTRVLLLQGRIDSEDGDRVEQLLDANPIDEVWLDSPGGNVRGGYAIGQALRTRGMVARVAKGHRCASACVDAFVGAPIRFVDDPYAIGIHPASAIGGTIDGTPLDQHIAGQIGEGGAAAARRWILDLEQQGNMSAAGWIRYVLDMGVSPSLVEYAASIPFDCMLWLSEQEYKHFNVVNTAGAPPSGFQSGESRLTCSSANFRAGVSAYNHGDYATAAQHFRGLAEQGHAAAQFNLGVLYAVGRGVPDNDGEAVRWFRLAAEQGNSGAQYALGRRYAIGQTVEQDDAEAIAWLERAAAQGHADAQSLLEAMHRAGRTGRG